MIRLASGLALAALASCAPPPGQVDVDPLDGNLPFSVGPFGLDGPPRIGTMQVRIADNAFTRGIFDYSVGAVDPAAFVRPDDTGPVLEIQGADPDQPLEFQRAIRLTAALDEGLRPGTWPVEVSYLLDGAPDGARLEGRGTLTLTEVTPPPQDSTVSLYGAIAGSFSARLCPLSELSGFSDLPCRAASGTFETSVYDMTGR